jgi:hypothetical protein
MSIFSFPGCLFNRHRPQRRGVSWDGRQYIGECRDCGEPIQRHGRRDWRKRKIESEDTEGVPSST